jgi:hypothetical protein
MVNAVWFVMELGGKLNSRKSSLTASRVTPQTSEPRILAYTFLEETQVRPVDSVSPRHALMELLIQIDSLTRRGVLQGTDRVCNLGFELSPRNR